MTSKEKIKKIISAYKIFLGKLYLLERKRVLIMERALKKAEERKIKQAHKILRDL
jgi:hypothetical protein